MKKTGLNGYVYEYSANYRTFNPSNIEKTMQIIHGYLIVKYGIVQKWYSIKTFQFIKKCFLAVSTFLTNINSLITIQLSFIAMNNQACKVRPEVINVNSNEPILYPFSIKTNKCRGSCNNINDPYAKICVPNVIKDLNIKVFNLMSSTNETRHIKWHETYKCKFRLEASVCNNKQR